MLGNFQIDDTLPFSVATHNPATGANADATSAPAYRVYENETSTSIATGTMSLLDDANTTGFYAETLTLSAANGYENGKTYSIYITATVHGVSGAKVLTFTVGLQTRVAEIAADAINAAAIADNAIGSAQLSDGALTAAKFGAAFIATSSFAAGAINDLAIADGAITEDNIAAGAITDEKFSSGALNGLGDWSTHSAADVWSISTAVQLATEVSAILEDTGTTIPATLVTIAEYIDTEVAAIKAVTDKLDSGLEADGASGYQWTALALENGPSSGGGGDATAANQVLMLAKLTGPEIPVYSSRPAAGTIELLFDADYDAGTPLGVVELPIDQSIDLTGATFSLAISGDGQTLTKTPTIADAGLSTQRLETEFTADDFDGWEPGALYSYGYSVTFLDGKKWPPEHGTLDLGGYGSGGA